jgi:hypothetical protein
MPIWRRKRPPLGDTRFVYLCDVGEFMLLFQEAFTTWNKNRKRQFS